jgi:DNA-binding NarL/FixJ family response regulator
MIRVVIADDHPVVREGLKYLISQNRDIQLVGEAEDGDATLETCRKLGPDVVLLDVSMPGPGVVEIIRNLRSCIPRPRILVLSVHPERQYARRALQAGADGYLTKNQSPGVLAGAIRHVYAGRKYITPSLAEEMAVDLAEGREVVAHDALSDREHEVLVRLGAGAVAKEIAQQLGLSPKTVRTYRSRLLHKMNLKSTAQLILYAVQNGLVPAAGESDRATTVGPGSSTDETPAGGRSAATSTRLPRPDEPGGGKP